jgi:hypothetical protein
LSNVCDTGTSSSSPYGCAQGRMHVKAACGLGHTGFLIFFFYIIKNYILYSLNKKRNSVKQKETLSRFLCLFSLDREIAFS